MFCKNCGKEVDSDAKFCPKCGKVIDEEINKSENQTDNNQKNVSAGTYNTISIIGFIFSFFMSLVGLILSIIGYKQAKKEGGATALAVAGIIISSISLFIEVVYVIFYIIYAGDMIAIINSDLPE